MRQQAYSRLEDPLNEATALSVELTELGQAAAEAAVDLSMQAAHKVGEAVRQGASKVATAVSGEEEQVEEQPQREPDRDLGHAEVPLPHHLHHPHLGSSGSAHEGHPAASHGPLERMKEAAAHAVEGVKMRLHLAGHSGQAGGGGEQQTAEQRTGEPLHMAKAAEGHNVAEDNPIDHALHEALRLERGEKPEVSSFPETLSDAVAAAQMKDLPSDPPSAAAAALAPSGEEPAPPNPFTSGARSKL